jgi:hypothetical protein
VAELAFHDIPQLGKALRVTSRYKDRIIAKAGSATAAFGDLPFAGTRIMGNPAIRVDQTEHTAKARAALCHRDFLECVEQLGDVLRITRLRPRIAR